MKWHISIALTATTIILGHAFVNLYEIAPVIGFNNLKLISGYLALSVLFLTLAAGYLRHKKFPDLDVGSILQQPWSFF